MARWVLTEREAGTSSARTPRVAQGCACLPENRLAAGLGATGSRLAPPRHRPGDAVLERLPRAPARLALEAAGVGDEERRVVGARRERAGADEVLAAGLARHERDEVADRHAPARRDVDGPVGVAADERREGLAELLDRDEVAD